MLQQGNVFLEFSLTNRWDKTLYGER